MHRFFPPSAAPSPKLLLTLAVAALPVVGLVLVGGSAGADDRPRSDRTVWLDVGALGRQAKAARRLTELHEEQAREGYRLLDVEPYIENGDLQGFWVSYAPVR